MNIRSSLLLEQQKLIMENSGKLTVRKLNLKKLWERALPPQWIILNNFVQFQSFQWFLLKKLLTNIIELDNVNLVQNL